MRSNTTLSTIGRWSGWALIGAALVLAFVSLGWLLLLPTLFAAGWLARRRPRWPSMLGTAFGGGATCVFVGFPRAGLALCVGGVLGMAWFWSNKRGDINP
jgi:hypothetical protein